MPEFFLELFSEEIPARMQARAAEDLTRLCVEALAPLTPGKLRSFHGPRRIALAADVAPVVAAGSTTERGPRVSAPEQALAGFLRKHGATREQVRREGEYWVLEKTAEATPATALIAGAIPPMLRRFPWPKSMRWGGASAFVWVRPLRRIVCLLDGAVVPFDLREGEDDAHGLASGDLTEGHRFHAPGAFAVASCADWAAKLRERRVMVDAQERRRVIAEGIAALTNDAEVVDDPGLLDEVAGLVEWPVPLLGRIDDTYLDLPPEVRQVSMRVNQRYFAYRSRDGSAAPYFGFVSNIAAADGGVVSVAGNERVLRARFADARHFWDLDRKARLESRVPLLDHVTFHARLGSQGERVRRLERLAEEIAPLVGAGAALARDAARLAKADLVTGMVGEFPELQGVMGRYYALHDGEDRLVADAIRDHYAPRGPADAVPTRDVSVAVALADKLDLLVGFFAIGERPTGAGDPYALRRAALGIIRIIRENGLWFGLLPVIALAGEGFHHHGVHPVPAQEVLDFLAERLRIALRTEGRRHDVLAAVFAAGADDVIPRLLSRTDAVAALLGTENGANLLTAYRRAANILRIESRKDGPHDGPPDQDLAGTNEERILFSSITDADGGITTCLREDDFGTALGLLADLRTP
ncbi:MAG TPA: glycine--tRNA ligase subunit beta, partial [Acetobacteraceae bacterium]|nr:glycine--tRNA ligase subunit beta [Acetobacteraceae bacterium]